MIRLLEILTNPRETVRNQSFEAACSGLTLEELLQQARELDAFRRREENLYLRVRALFFLAALFRYQIPQRLERTNVGSIPFAGHVHLLQRRFVEAIDVFLDGWRNDLATDARCSALAEAYHRLAFQTLADQVRRSVRSFRGNQWMFRIGHPDDHPLRVRAELMRSDEHGSRPILCEKTAVRMDFSHSAWSDIFFLGMDYPEGARVLNVSVDLGVRGRDAQTQPPIEAYFRVIDEPVIRLVSVDLQASTVLQHIQDVFDFARDYLGLLKAALIAAGIVPSGLEGCDGSIGQVLQRLLGPGLGIELVSKINDIPKGSRLAVSTNLLGSLISVCMRATGQVSTLVGGLEEADRRTVAARAILGEWLGGSGGGWQDSGGVWPGIKLIQGVPAAEGDPEFGISRGCLMPIHHVFGEDRVSPAARKNLQDSLVLVHGGMAQNVGPILEMVTEHYLLRGAEQWQARQEAMQILDEVVDALQEGDVQRIGRVTTRNFEGPLQTIIPWATNRFTDTLIDRCRREYREKFWGFWMLGGMSGGGMGFMFDPAVKPEAQVWLQETMSRTRKELQDALPFAMEPVVYDFTINDSGSFSEMIPANQGMPDRYYALLLSGWLRSAPRDLSAMTRRELELLGNKCRAAQNDLAPAQMMLESLLPLAKDEVDRKSSLRESLAAFGFDPVQHEQIRAELRAGRIGLAQNRLPRTTSVTDVQSGDVIETREGLDRAMIQAGEEALRRGELAIVTLAAGVGSRWTEGAGVCKALHPFYKFAGRHRSFLEVHLAKTRRDQRRWNTIIPHLFTTGYLTDAPIRAALSQYPFIRTRTSVYDLGQPQVLVSSARAVGLRTIPMVRDLRFAWEEMPQQVLDEQRQKVRDSLRGALIDWAVRSGEGSDYTDNTPAQCMHPVGHWYEFPNMLANGTLRQLLQVQPSVKYLLLHNVDTLGAHADPGLLGLHLVNGSPLSFEVIPRRLEDRGGGLARVNGQLRLVEGLAMPDEAAEFRLSYYNSMTTWIEIDSVLRLFGLDRDRLEDMNAVARGIRAMAQRVPTYITLKDVKKRWGHGQEDVFPVAQFEKLWGDTSALPEAQCRYFVTDFVRGQQLKQQSQLDGWLRDGSAAKIQSLCDWE
jgi:hypothetical protein